MSNYLEFLNEVLDETPSLKKEMDILSIKYDIIRKLIEYRRKYNLSQKDFADKIGVKQQMISRFEKGEVDARLSFVSKIICGMNQIISFTEQDYVMTENIVQFDKFKKRVNLSTYSLDLLMEYPQAK